MKAERSKKTRYILGYFYTTTNYSTFSYFNIFFTFLFDDIDTGFAVPAAADEEKEEDFILCFSHVDLFPLSVMLSASLSVPKNQPLPQRPALRSCL